MRLFLFLFIVSPICGTRPSFDPYVSNEEGFKAAGEMLKLSMNLSIDPCQDFFEFACGNWKKNNPLPSDMTAFTQFTKLKKKVFEELRDLLESNESTTLSTSINMARLFYKACMEEEKINKLGLPSMLQDITELGYFPLLHWINWEHNNFDLTNLLKKASSRGLFLFIDVTVGQDLRDSKKTILIFSEGSLGLGEGSEEYYLNRTKYSQQINAYKRMMAERVKLITKDVGLPVNDAKIEEDIESVLKFELSIARQSIDAIKKENSSSYVRLDELNILFPLIRWKEYLFSVTPPIVHDYLRENPEVKIPATDYFQRLADLLRSENPATITNYVFLRFIDTYALQLGYKYDEIEQDFLRDMFGRQKKPPRWKECVNEVKEEMSYAVGAIYARKYFDKETEVSIRKMLADLFEEFKRLLEEADWMSEESRRRAEVKLSKMKKFVGNPKFFMDDKKLDDWYKDIVQFSGKSQWVMKKELIKWKTALNFKTLVQEVKGNILGDFVTTTNAFYYPSINGIILPVAFLQTPFFGKNYPKALNYGAIGSILAHEITHGFDDNGRTFDEAGNNRIWWDESTTEEFIKRTHCFKKKYGMIQIPELSLNIDGEKTLGENIADTAGIKQSFRAYQRHISQFGVEKRVSGFEDFDNYQLFFIGYAQNWCGHMTKENMIRRLLTDNHALSRYRVNLVLANKPEFAFAFKCPPTSPMVSSVRCNLW